MYNGMMTKKTRYVYGIGQCAICGRWVASTRRRTAYVHGPVKNRCPGSATGFAEWRLHPKWYDRRLW